MTDRGLSYQILLDIFYKNELSHIALKKVFDTINDKSETNKAFVKTLVNGVCEYYESFGYIISSMTGRGIAKLKPQIRIIISMGLYQGFFMNVPISAACNESVKLAKKNGFTGLSGFVNGVMRNVFRIGEDYTQVTAKILDDNKADEKTRLVVKYSIPAYIADIYEEQFGRKNAEAAFEAFLVKRKVTIVRITSNCSSEELEASLKKDGYEFRAIDDNREIYELAGPVVITEPEAYKKGYFIVQDLSSYLAGRVINKTDRPLVLDMCAAPGGKLLHMADTIKSWGGVITGRDLSVQKVNLINQNIKRVRLDNVTAEVMDATVINEADIDKYDVVLADLPCSGLGVIAKKPDIRYKTGPDDIISLSKIQKSILKNAVKYVKKDGFLLYSTCTLTREENEENALFIKSFGFEGVDIKEYFDLIKEDIVIKDNCLSILPTKSHDGFFAALFKKTEKFYDRY